MMLLKECTKLIGKLTKSGWGEDDIFTKSIEYLIDDFFAQDINEIHILICISSEIVAEMTNSNETVLKQQNHA